MQIRGSVHLVHPTSVIRMPPVLRLHLMCVPAIPPAATGVNAIKNTSETDLTAQVSYSRLSLETSVLRTYYCHIYNVD